MPVWVPREFPVPCQCIHPERGWGAIVLWQLLKVCMEKVTVDWNTGCSKVSSNLSLLVSLWSSETSSSVWSIRCLWFEWCSSSQVANPIHASLIKASYTYLCTQIALFHCRLSITAATEPSAMILDSMQMSLRPASWKCFPNMLMALHIVWKVSSLELMPEYCSLCFQTTFPWHFLLVSGSQRQLPYVLLVYLWLEDRQCCPGGFPDLCEFLCWSLSSHRLSAAVDLIDSIRIHNTSFLNVCCLTSSFTTSTVLTCPGPLLWPVL